MVLKEGTKHPIGDPVITVDVPALSSRPGCIESLGGVSGRRIRIDIEAPIHLGTVRIDPRHDQHVKVIQDIHGLVAARGQKLDHSQGRFGGHDLVAVLLGDDHDRIIFRVADLGQINVATFVGLPDNFQFDQTFGSFFNLFELFNQLRVIVQPFEADILIVRYPWPPGNDIGFTKN